MFSLLRFSPCFFCVIFTCFSIGLNAEVSSSYPNPIGWSSPIIQYFYSLEEDSSLEEAFDALICLHSFLERENLAPPSIPALVRIVESILKTNHTDLDERVLSGIERELVRRVRLCKISIDPSFILQHIKQSSKKKEDTKDPNFVEVPGRCIIGAVKVLAGGLICVIPNGYAKAAGITLMGSGVQDITEALVEKDKENVEHEKKYGPPEPPPHFPRDFYEKKRMSC